MPAYHDRVIYRGVRADVRCRGGQWLLAGVVLRGDWHPAFPDLPPASGGMLRTGMAKTVKLPAFIAPNDRTAWKVALEVGRMAGYPVPMDRYQLPGGDGYWIAGPDLSDVL